MRWREIFGGTIVALLCASANGAQAQSIYGVGRPATAAERTVYDGGGWS